MNIKLLEDLENKVIKPKGQIPFSDFDKISSEVVGKADFAPEFIIDGMVKRLRWDRKKPVDRAVMLISANDPVGVMLDGLKRGDTISIVSIDGIASFANGSWLDKFISGILSVAGELGKLFSDELTDKVIDAAIEKIKKELKEKRRLWPRRSAEWRVPHT